MELTNEEKEAILRARAQTQLEKEAGIKATDGRSYAMVDTKHMSTINHLYPPPREKLLLDYFVYKMNKSNACMVSQKKLCGVLSCSKPTLIKIVAELQSRRIIDVLKIGAQNCYVMNSQVAWKAGRGGIKTSVFNATVVVDWDEQLAESIKTWNTPLISLSKEIMLEAKETIDNHILDELLTADKQKELEL